MVTKSRILELFRYSPEEDNAKPLIRLMNIGKEKQGDRAGYIDPRGYVYVMIDAKQYYMHRVVYFLFNGYFPETIDHINRDKSDNRIENLRAASQNENSYNLPIRNNNTSGISGVNWNKKDKAWHVRIRHQGKRIWIGQYKEKKIAIEARYQAVNKYHKEFKGE